MRQAFYFSPNVRSLALQYFVSLETILTWWSDLEGASWMLADFSGLIFSDWSFRAFPGLNIETSGTRRIVFPKEQRMGTDLLKCANALDLPSRSEIRPQPL
jgi:hypothetical protein